MLRDGDQLRWSFGDPEAGLRIGRCIKSMASDTCVILEAARVQVCMTEAWWLTRRRPGGEIEAMLLIEVDNLSFSGKDENLDDLESKLMTRLKF